jgi:hypothetical protein
MREALRDILPTSLAYLVLLDGLFARRRHADSPDSQPRGSAGMGEAVFSSRLARTRATKHEAAHAETKAVAEDAVAAWMRARCVTTWSTLQIAAKAPSCGQPTTDAIYLLDSAAGVPKGRSAALVCAGAPVSEK